jgi:hypothetical protein
MGLDISYYKLGKRVEVDENIERYSDEWYEKYGNGPELIRLSDYYGWDQSDGMMDGFYEADYLGSFRAGSYSGYSWFRNTLTKLANIALLENDKLKDMYGPDSEPFESLTNFSDSEGFIGPFTSRDLATTFNDFEGPIIKDIIKMAKYGVKTDLYQEFGKEDLEYFTTKYREWRNAFEAVSGEGVVLFH